MQDEFSLTFGDLPPEERQQRMELQRGLPNPQNLAAKLVILKRPSISTVLVGDLSPVQFMTAAIAAANELPASCLPASVVFAVFNAASLGLMFGSVRGEAYLVPFKDTTRSKQEGRDIHEVSLIIGYKGFRNLAYRSNYLKSFTTEVVLQGESFECWVDETGRHFKHITPIDRSPSSSGSNVVASYCQYTTRTGGSGVVVVERKQLEASAKKTDIWRNHFPAMAQKTAIRRAAKEWNTTELLNAAVVIDEQAEAGLIQGLLCDVGVADIEGIDQRKPRRLKTGASSVNQRLEDLKREGGSDAVSSEDQ